MFKCSLESALREHDWPRSRGDLEAEMYMAKMYTQRDNCHLEVKHRTSEGPDPKENFVMDF